MVGDEMVRALIDATNEIARSSPFIMGETGLPSVCYVCSKTGKPTWVEFTRGWLSDRLAERFTFFDGDGKEIPPRADLVAELHNMILAEAREKVRSGNVIRGIEAIYSIGGW